MKFTDYTYRRPNLKTVSKRFQKLMAEFDAAATFADARAVLQRINRLRRDFGSTAAIGQIRHTIDTRDTFYDAENQFFDEKMPVFEALTSEFYKKLIAHPFRSELENEFGAQLFNIADLQIRTVQPSILPLLQDENKLAS